MKRNSDGYNSGGANKRSRMGPDDIELRVLIPSRCAGSIIGKGGANISRLRTDYSAKVTIPDCPGPERILSITATLDQAVNVLGEALPNMEIYGAAGGGRRNRNQPEERSGDNDLRFLVHQSQAGCVIGKGGGKIKELRERTGSRIKVFAACCPNSTDRVVAINGTDEKCLSSLKEILTLIREQAPIKGEVIPYDPTNFDVYYASEYGGFGGGEPDEMGGGPPAGRRMGPRGYGDGPPPGRGRRGGPGGGGAGGGRGYGGGGGYGGDGYGSGGYEGDYESMGGGVPPVGIGNGGGPPGIRETTQVTIPKDMAGAIIGKSGMKIRQVRQESGADITVAEALPGCNDRIITIIGTPNEIQNAQYLLQQCVHENMRPGGKY